ncbi:MAG: hypothetical protein IJY78_06405 [Bacteroidaceae bacterium]|nr:hypothetical protein [Bacteroidaceae bacterium]
MIIEFSSWHDECLYTICSLMKSEGTNVTLALNEDLAKKVGDSLNDVSDKIIYYPFKKGIKGFISTLKLYHDIIKEGYTHLYFNSAQGSVQWKFFILPIPKRIKTIGTLHNIIKLKNSIGQKIITRRMDGYVLLNDILTKKYKEFCNIPTISIYPIIYPELPLKNIHNKKVGEIWIVIPGAVSIKRRDYFSLFKPGTRYAPNIKFIILGNKNKEDGNKIFKHVNDCGMTDNFIFFDKFIPNDVFYSYIQECDYIMPLIHPHIPIYNKYVTEKISGTYNLAIAYKKIMLCPIEMNNFEDFTDTSLFYPADMMAEFINDLPNKTISHNDYYKLDKWNKNNQQNRLKSFLSHI